MSWSNCPGSVSGHDDGDRDGKCTWCRRRVSSPVPEPRMPPGYRTELDLAWRRAHDDDWGSDPHDIDV